MKKASRIFLMGLWLLFGTYFFSYWLYAHPGMFPQLPSQLWRWLDKLYGADNVDGASDVEALVVLIAAFTATVIVTWVAWLLWRRIQTKNR